jgi:hypothetical protein
METTDKLIKTTTEMTAVPTRWGNQLNGNVGRSNHKSHQTSCRPHSLGKPIEWKRQKNKVKGKENKVPTRWGNQLNGNL